MKRLFIFISALTAALLWSCQSEKEHHAHENTIFKVSTPLLKDTTVNREYISQIRSSQHIELRALEKGYLKDIYVDEGEFVKKGQLMFRIMPLIYQAEAKKADAEAQFAKIEYLNTKALADSNIVSQSELALAKAKYEKAKAELDLANIHLSFTEIHAPFDGIMGRFHVRLGSLVDEGELLTELSDNRNIWVYFNVPEAEYLNLMSKLDKDHPQKVKLRMANNEIFSHIGVIETIEADFNNETGNIAFRAAFPNPEGLLRHGETGNIQITSEVKNALIIPQKATYEVLDKKFVFVMDENGVLKSRKIIIDKELPNIYIVKEGLLPNDKILLDGLRKVKNNDKVKYEIIQPEEALSHLELYAE